jgi:hypothetical protein
MNDSPANAPRSRATLRPKRTRAERRTVLRGAGDMTPVVERTDRTIYDGTMMTTVRYERGIIRLSEHERPSDHTERRSALLWHQFSELDLDHSWLVTFYVLDEAGLLNLSKDEVAGLAEEIRVTVDAETWTGIEEHLAYIDKLEIDREVFIVAVWADLFIQKLSDTWLAAMAYHACYVEHNDYAVGYFTAKLDTRREVEPHFLRGKRGMDNAKAGGAERARRLAGRSEGVLREMKRLVAKGRTVASAAARAHENGKGKSPAANSNWYRHLKKLGHSSPKSQG